jgi:telomere length regulation protein
MACGYVHRKQPMFLFTIAKSSSQMHGVSNRLNSTSPRARWLGMIVSMTISALTDKKENQLVFTDDAMDTTEAKWYRQLVLVNDRVGRLDDIRKARPIQHEMRFLPEGNKTVHLQPQQVAKRNKAATKIAAPSGLRIVELDSDEEDELIPYAKPDSDPEDEDEDPTLVQRNKPKAPV